MSPKRNKIPNRSTRRSRNISPKRNKLFSKNGGLKGGGIKVLCNNDETVATDVFEEDHGVVKCAVAEPVRLVVANGHKVNVPVIVGKALIVTVFVEVALAQPLLPVAVNVRVTEPAVISAALGVYVQVVKEVELANVPVPLDVHVVTKVFVALDPVVMLIAPEFEQVVIAVPATAVGKAFTVTVTETVLGVVAGIEAPQGEVPLIALR